MIRPCVCSKTSSSLLGKSKHRESSKSCKSCSGKLPVDEQGAQRGSMLSTIGLELSRVIDPHLTWKTASNGRQRAVRRARTSFTGINGKYSPAKSSKGSRGRTDKDSKITVDMAVSESEKVGVSILGRRFSEALGSVPIKKRRFQFGHSTSPSHHSSYSEHSDQLFERQPSSYQDTVLNKKQLSLDTNSGSGSEFSHENSFVCERSERDLLNEKVSDAADFSGISILAAVACESNIGADFLNLEVTLSKEHASELQGVSKGSDNLEKQELLPHTSEEDLACRTDLPFETSSSSALPSKESNEKSDGSCNPENSVNSIQTIPSKTMESSFCDVKFHWDLNTVMDIWDGHEEGLYSEKGTINNVSEDGDHNNIAGNTEPYMDQVGFKDTKDGSTDSSVVNTRDHLGGGVQKVMCALEAKIEEKCGIPSGNSASDLKESLPCSSPENGYNPVEWQSKDSKVGVGGVHEETKFLINKDRSCSVSRDVPSPANNLQDSSLSTASKIEEEKSEASCIILLSKVGSENSSFVNSCDNKIGCSSKRDCESHLGVPIEAEICVQMNNVSDMRIRTAEEHASSYFDPVTAKSELATASVISGADTKTNASGEADHCDAGKSKEKDVFEYETSAIEMMVNYTENSTPGDDIDVAKKDSSIDKSFCDPGDCRNYTDDCNVVCGKAASEDGLECGYNSDTSQNDANQVPGMEKVELSGDDDSQYEDGEFRESLGNCWLDDGGEEGGTECVDYGTDRDIDACEAGSGLSASVNCHVNSQGLPDANDAHCRDFRRGTGDDRSDTGKGWQGHLRTSAISKNSDFSAGNGNVIGDDGFHKQEDGYRDSIHAANYRMKMSGWDKLPGGGRSSGNGTANSIGYRKIHNDNFSDPSRSGGTMKREVLVRRDLSSRTERVRSSDVTRRSDEPYFSSTNRNRRAERDGDTRRSFGRSGVPLHLQDRNRGDWWGGSRHGSSGYSHHGSKNAAAAVVATLESNGFVIAPDGTIIKAGTTGSLRHLTRRPVNAHHSPMERGSPIERERSFGMHSGPIRSREMSPDRPLFMGRKAVRYGADHMEGYRGPIHDDIVESTSPPHCPISRRDRSFSPHRRPMNMFRSRSRSPSRSRTRSPHRWTSPKGRITYGMNRGPVLRRRSRSPSFKHEARIDTRTRAGFREPGINYASLPRNRTSPSHSSRWTDGRKEYEYRQCPGRSPPPRVITRGHRPDFTDSPGRTKPEEYYRPAVLRRLPETVDFDSRRARNGGMIDYRREHDARYVNSGNMNHLRCDDENGFRPQNLRSKSSEFERRDRRGPLDGGDRQLLGDSPSRSIEGKCHLKSDGDGSNNDNMVDVQGRPL